MVVDTAPGWRTVYWVGLASGVSLSIATFLTYRPEAPLATRNVSAKEVLRDFDYLGFIGITSGITLFLMGIVWEPQYGSTSPHFLAPLTIGILVTIGTGFQQVYWTKSPILHPFLWRRFRTFTLQAIVVFVSGMLFYSLQALYPQFMTSCFVGNDPIQVGISQLPLGVSTVGGVISGLVLPWLSRRIGTNGVLAVGVFICALFIALIAVVDYDQQGMAMGLASAATFGIGKSAYEHTVLSWTNLLSIPLIQLCAPDEWIGFATGLRTLMSLGGGSVATSVFTTIFTGRAAEFVPEDVSAAAAAAGLPSSSIPALLSILTGATPNISPTSVPGLTSEIMQVSQVALKKAYIRSFRYVWYSSIPFGVVALVAAAYTKDLTPVMTEKVAQVLKTVKPSDNEDVEKDIFGSNKPTSEESEQLEKYP
ncbi:uncharacterized protein Z518_03525 [Rhinocladiella mackenziei CBS 650.93]|uniref:Major facilitator superfamily (MFS) profile domain-containing protein n=1 Tax=Rhinocladiella mackenziei CBS 650.93 TaxID=1442369 RepID=A0A0D2HE73_9EURO|nr:uncharacterized protein Z518_03525 [Rhinocladiella mackenziei CBS 650.93]KIX08868.1 hypothetical protein Z518_03525 [Rhinocladiella mackenziei CBS 650.93]